MLDAITENATSALAASTTRRSFLGRVGVGFVAFVGGPFVAIALRPDRAEAYHICGHTYTTDSCPHPYNPLSRVDKWGYPLHPTKGYPVDDNGELYKSRKQPRHRMCEETVPNQYPYTGHPQQGGGWSRCCSGRVRRIYDCCSYSDRRINGDASVTGYCYGGRKVFCIGFRQLRTRC